MNSNPASFISDKILQNIITRDYFFIRVFYENEITPTSIPAKAGISSRESGNFREAEQMSPSANAAVAAEIPAFAGMENKN